MDLLTGIRAFVGVVDSGSFAGAARALGVSRPALSKYVAQLERRLDAQLLQRSTRRVNVTPVGRAFYQQALAALEHTDAALALVAQHQQRLEGRLRVNAPMSFGRLHLADAVAGFMREHPQVQLELVLNDRFVDLIEEGFDVSVRVAEPEHATSLMLEELAVSARVLCASPAYLAAAAPLVQPADLQRHRCLFYGYESSGHVWRLQGPGGSVSVPVRCALWSNNGEVLRCAARADQGVALLPTFIVGGDLQEGSLVRVLPDFQLSPLTVHALYARHRSVSPRVRAFVDFLARWFSGTPRWALVQ
ncbi:MAG: LysR substrate-binding domain-containing protein [Pseudomonadales bacterium]